MFKDFPPKAHADHGHWMQKVIICDESGSPCARVRDNELQVDTD